MSKLPPFVYAKAFWQGVSLIGAGVLALLVYFQVLPVDYAVDAGAIYVVILGVLKFFKITPELRARGLMK